ncbi:MAG: LLM class flavin-dependent oxidoreductase, partial [Micromonosporaceae bacterium]
PDLATYGKLLGGGYPIGAIAGRADIMDGVDGGFWRYGDDSYPAADTTFFGGTYIQHPLSMAAAGAVLRHLKNHSPQLQIDVNRRTDWLAESVNQFCVAEEFPLQVAHFGSMFRFEHRANMELLYHHLMLRGVYIWEWRNFFLSTAHGDDDVEFIANAVRESLRELRRAGFFPGSNRTAAAGVPKPAGVEPTATESAGVSQARPTAAAQPAAGAQPAPAATVRPASVAQPAAAAARHSAPDLSLYFFGDYPRGTDPAASYELIADAAQFADQHGFHAVWLPERHFHSFGGAFPNPAVLAAGLARETRQIRLNAGSVVLPLHDVIRVAEEWAMVDNLSGGRVGIGCASGWNTQDFVFFPDRFARRKELMYEQVAQLRALWRGDPLRRVIADAGPGAGRAAGRGAPGANGGPGNNGVFSSNGTAGSNGGYGSNGRPGDPAPAEADIRLFPRPVQAMP